MTAHTEIWDRLGKTDPAHTKGFKRSGGFSGTAIKPQWVIRRLTEEFGPCGVGWGMEAPSFEVVPAGEETLVFCTVQAWHGERSNIVFGVGGDKAIGKNKYGPYADDEAFKKAYTDALMNAFKFLGVGADVHMGLFDDSKYVAQARAEFAGEPANNLGKGQRDGGPGPVEAKDFWGCSGPGKSAHAAKKDGTDEAFDRMRQEIAVVPTTAALREWIETNQADISTMPASWRSILREECEERGIELGHNPNERKAA